MLALLYGLYVIVYDIVAPDGLEKRVDRSNVKFPLVTFGSDPPPEITVGAPPLSVTEIVVALAEVPYTFVAVTVTLYDVFRLALVIVRVDPEMLALLYGLLVTVYVNVAPDGLEKRDAKFVVQFPLIKVPVDNTVVDTVGLVPMLTGTVMLLDLPKRLVTLRTMLPFIIELVAAE